MPKDFWDSLAEFSLNAGLELLKSQRESVSQEDKRQMANLIVSMSVHSACDVVNAEDSAARLKFDQFMEIAAIFMGSTIAFFRNLTGVSIGLSDSSLNMVRECAVAFQRIKEQVGQVSVTGAVIKR